MTVSVGKWDPLVDFHLFQVNVTNFASSASHRLCRAWKITVCLVSLALKSLAVFLKDLIAVQPGMRQDYG